MAPLYMPCSWSSSHCLTSSENLRRSSKFKTTLWFFCALEGSTQLADKLLHLVSQPLLQSAAIQAAPHKPAFHEGTLFVRVLVALLVEVQATSVAQELRIEVPNSHSLSLTPKSMVSTRKLLATVVVVVIEAGQELCHGRALSAGLWAKTL